MNCSKGFLAALLLVGLCCSEATAGRRTPTNKKLQLVLKSEAAGYVTNRAKLLESELKATRKENPAFWQAGYVRDGNHWVKYDELLRKDEEGSVWDEYQSRRNEASESFEGRIQLANWCRSHRLAEQERVHLLEALKLQNDSVPVLTRLGFHRRGGTWLNEHEQQLLAEEQKNRAAAMKKWLPRLNKIREDLMSGSERRKDNAEKKLVRLNDPDVVDAITQTLFGTEVLELAVVKALQQMRTYQAAHALVDLAVTSKSNWVRSAAVDALRDKPQDHFIPELLSQLSTPAETAIEMRYQNGQAFIRQVYRREGQYERLAQIMQTTIRMPNQRNNRRISDFNIANSQRIAEDLAREQEDLAQQFNAQTKNNNARIYTVLKDVTDVDLSDDPHAWWQWWNSEQDIEVTSKAYRYSSYQQSISTLPSNLCECLRAGTPVWTEQGLTPIEQIRAGDRVLSKNVETGELAYKPVLEPTQRPELDLKQVKLDEETIICTPGHLFWVSGQGWKMAQEIESSSALHTVTGATAVRAVNNGPSEKVYNLIVDDFHTYFVGRAKILSHDNTIREPTNVVVPGLKLR